MKVINWQDPGPKTYRITGLFVLKSLPAFRNNPSLFRCDFRIFELSQTLLCRGREC